MAFSYSGNPADSDKDAVRFLIGDTDSNDPLVTDEEIAWQLGQRVRVHLAASSCCVAIAAKFSRKADRSVGNLRASFSQQADAYRTLAQDLEAQAADTAVLQPFAGSSDEPRFTRDMHTFNVNEGR